MLNGFHATNDTIEFIIATHTQYIHIALKPIYPYIDYSCCQLPHIALAEREEITSTPFSLIKIDVRQSVIVCARHRRFTCVIRAWRHLWLINVSVSISHQHTDMRARSRKRTHRPFINDGNWKWQTAESYSAMICRPAFGAHDVWHCTHSASRMLAERARHIHTSEMAWNAYVYTRQSQGISHRNGSDTTSDSLPGCQIQLKRSLNSRMTFLGAVIETDRLNVGARSLLCVCVCCVCCALLLHSDEIWWKLINHGNFQNIALTHQSPHTIAMCGVVFLRRNQKCMQTHLICEAWFGTKRICIPSDHKRMEKKVVLYRPNCVKP